ncbi:MAG: hypothetical protein CTY25_05625 [Methylobacterium sp.]|nr:MAG: hypothetical protein CTY25_05625 [Methylobacterium sp.]
MANDEHNAHPKRQWQGISSQSIVAVLVAVLVFAVIYTAGMMMWGESSPDRTTTGTVQSQPSSNPPTVAPPPLTPSQQTAPDQLSPQPNPQVAPPRSGGG